MPPIDALSEAAAVAADVTALRHELHAHPELGTDLPWTQGRVLAALDGLPLEITCGTSSTSVTAVLRGGAADADLAGRPVVLLRGDMDGLPVPEDTGQQFASTIEGRMHACGHDMHTSTLVGAARVLCKHREHLRGDVVFMFQTGEEVLLGARCMLAEGVLDAAGKRADRAFGLHAASAQFDTGTFHVRPGPMMAACDTLTADIIGIGGHGSTPDKANDPVPVMAEVILALQTVVTRKFSIFDPVVVNVGVANAGGACNVVPQRCHIEAAVRSFSPEAREKLGVLLPQLVTDVCTAHGCRADVQWTLGVPPTINHEGPTQFALAQMRELFGDQRTVVMDEPLAGSEDFAFVLEEVPGCFIFYSAVPANLPLEQATFNHATTAMFDDAPMADAVALYVQLAVASIEELASAD